MSPNFYFKEGELEIEIEKLLGEEGFDNPKAVQTAWSELVRSGLTTRNKKKITSFKRPKVVEVLTNLAKVCSEDCLKLASKQKTVVFVSARNCSVCSGSNTIQAGKTFQQALLKRGIKHVVIVGGTPQQIVEIKGFCGIELEFRFVDGGSPSHSLRDAEVNKNWADLILVWVPSEIKHRVTTKYLKNKQAKTILIQRRGVESLFREVLKNLEEGYGRENRSGMEPREKKPVRELAGERK